MLDAWKKYRGDGLIGGLSIEGWGGRLKPPVSYKAIIDVRSRDVVNVMYVDVM